MDLAERRNGVVINADASQVYADLRILSARPSPADEARVPHRLYGVIDGARACSAADWAELAKMEIAAVHEAGKLPVLVGGTGLYLRTLLDGIAPVPEIDPDVRTAVRSLPVDELHPALSSEDPVMAARLGRADRQRLCRALEVVRSTGRSLALWQQELAGGIGDSVTLDARVVDIDRATLHARCDTRFDVMIDAGALDEVARLASRRLPETLPVMKALGVPPLLAALRGELPLPDAIAQGKATTRQYAKRQQTWFRNQTPGWRRVDRQGNDLTIR